MVDGLRIVRAGLAKGERIVVNGLQRFSPTRPSRRVEVTMERSAGASPAEVAAAGGK